MKLGNGLCAGILAGWIGILSTYGYFRIKHDIENYAVIMFSEGTRLNKENHYTNNSCLTEVNAYGHDLDGIKRLELNIDNQSYFAKEFGNLEKMTEYSITIDLCHPRLLPGMHEIKLKITDIYNNEETDTDHINVIGEIQVI